MSKIEDFAFYGASGSQYIFQVYPIGTEFKDIGGIYIFTRREINFRGGATHNLLYIGGTNSLPSRLTRLHHKWEAVFRNRGNCVCVYSEPHDLDRNRIENDLIHKYQPPLNKRLE
ncbi:hypothetical protein C6501_01080 [Candidatus Poribacteria bacterium]|nr:MAG: hypothetical protein C6501_01080 [Candidatus Poribacteria bacterium]